ncbi:YybH family protein [Rhodococcus artemisiae]|uniref:SgcJ/EcaC family oxidoreductase n=1 Tax=Rhodococcus artemisiae TaxID=714159 RepID=A0ABU7LGH7_9NOCA|nr:SgcJ/EcaC family oxidoreductase [Rhodococcus artemisiae]MEE2060669.1 SgcJ/EcaC family oxidoreductase [Rhodococcus artemisiae]
MTSTTPDHRDLEQIQTIVRDVQEGFNTNDASLMNAHLADDAIVVNARGAVLFGRAAIQKASEDALAAGYLNESTAYYELSDVAGLSADVIVARKNAWSTKQDADDGDPPEMNALYIFVKRGGRWLIWRRQNTIVSS